MSQILFWYLDLVPPPQYSSSTLSFMGNPPRWEVSGRVGGEWAGRRNSFLNKWNQNCSKAAGACPLNNFWVSSELDQVVQFCGPLNEVPPAIFHVFLREEKLQAFSRPNNKQKCKSKEINHWAKAFYCKQNQQAQRANEIPANAWNVLSLMQQMLNQRIQVNLKPKNPTNQIEQRIQCYGLQDQ